MGDIDYKLDPLFVVAFLKKQGINYERYSTAGLLARAWRVQPTDAPPAKLLQR
jgi:hypothetical protein